MRARTITWLLAMVLSLLATTLRAQDQKPEVGQDPAPTAAAIQARIDAVKADASLGEELSKTLPDVLARALEHATEADKFADAASTFAAATARAPADLVETRRLLASTDTQTPPNPAADATIRDLEQRLAEEQQKQQAAASEVLELEKQTTHRAERRASIPARLVEVRRLLEALPSRVVDENVDPRLLTARRQRLAAERHRYENELASLDAEQASYVARDELLPARRDLAARRANTAKAVAEIWQTLLQERRAADARAQQAAAQQAAAQALAGHPLLARLAAENAEMAKELPPLVAQREDLEKRLQLVRDQQTRLKAQFDDVQRRAERAGATQAIGALLRERRAQLPGELRHLRRRDHDATAANAFLESLNWEDRRRALTDDTGLLDRLIADADPQPADPRAAADLRRRAQELITARLETVRRLSDGWSSYLANIEEVDATERAVGTLVATYRAFVNERVLWIRSSNPIWRLELRAVLGAAWWLSSPAAWQDTLAVLWVVIASEIWPLFLAALLAISLLLRPLFLRRLTAHGVTALRGNNVSYKPTALALLDTLILAAPLPCLLWLLGGVLAQHADCTEFGHAIGAGLLHSAGFLAVVRGLREVVRRNGLAEVHFQWQDRTLALLRGNLWLLVPAAFPLATALGALEHRGDDAWLGAGGRLLLIPLLVLLIAFLFRVLHPDRGVLATGKDASAMRRFRRLWFALGCGTPVALLGLTVFGYEFTALQLARSVLYTVALVLAGVVVHDLILRKLLLERRRLSIQQSRERARAARAAAEGDEEQEEEDEEVQLDPSSIARQTHTVVRGGIALGVLFLGVQIWIDVLPALGVLRQVVLWLDHSTEPSIQITLADLLMSMVVMAVTAVASRNLPGLLELLVLQRFKMAAGERNAITTLARYVLFTFGVVIAFGSIGLGWSKVQWLLTALLVGLGFGLQEIFANFVSGLILLFERPVRVGDIVVVGDVLGTVTRIKIRATTIRDLDNRELVVPNREFVTGRFMNWTLTDSLVRMRVKVGVAYGSDTVKARRLLVQAARESRFAAKSPAPKALFLGFGDSTLDLELRVFIEDYSEHADMLDDVHGRIDRLFHEHGVEIAFPQRDLHLRSAPPLVEFLRRGEVSEPDAPP